MQTPRRQFLAISFRGFLLLGATTLKRNANAASRPASLARFDPQVRKLMSRMTLDEKIGQMTQADQSFLRSIDDIEKYALGSLLSGGDSDPKTGNDLRSWTDLYDGYQSRALKTRLRIPLLYGVDAVHGHNNVLGATIFPHNIGLGCTRNPELVERAAHITAEEVRATGINWAFAPCVTVPQDIRWGRTYEGFSESPEVVKVLGEAAVQGLQQGGLENPLAVLSCPKHFAGDGGTTFGTGMPLRKGSDQRYPLDRGDTRVDEQTLRKVHLPGYITAIRAGAASIMPSYNSWNGLKCSGNQHLLTDILKNEFGFEGFLISDYAALNELPGDYQRQVTQSINAGMDMVMVPDDYPKFFETLKRAVEAGGVGKSRIDDAVTRILRVKFAMGLMEPNRSLLADRDLHKTFGSPEHRAVARQCVRESLVLLKNENKALPISKTAARIHIAGKSADDTGLQCGGWTIAWQGGRDVIQGTTILSAIRKAVSGNATVTYSKDGSGASGATVGVVIFGEMPYAEMKGDRADLSVAPEDVAAIDNLKSAGIPVIAVLVSGRPLLIDAVLDKVDALLAAWLPGTEGEGVSEVLFGDSKPKGKLSFTWPRASSTSLHLGDAGYQTLFPFGHGLSW